MTTRDKTTRPRLRLTPREPASQQQQSAVVPTVAALDHGTRCPHCGHRLDAAPADNDTGVPDPYRPEWYF